MLNHLIKTWSNNNYSHKKSLQDLYIKLETGSFFLKSEKSDF